MVTRVSSVGVIDKSLAVLDAVAGGATTLALIVEASGLNRATAHRLATALEVHGLLRRDDAGAWGLGFHLWALGQRALGPAALADAARPVVERLRDDTGESAQLFVADGLERLCVASVESPHGLRTIVPLGARLPIDKGSGGAALTGDAAGEAADKPWWASVGERELGVASVSAPVRSPDGSVVAAISVSGPIERLTDDPGARYGATVADAARALEALLAGD
ncbi:MAG: IclR family transcriptional regulator [Acidimicrobiales bacterium]